MKLLFNDLGIIFRWWLFLLFWGGLSFPLWRELAPRRFWAFGWIFAKILTTAIISYTVFWLATFHILPFSLGAISLVVLLLLAVSIWLAWRDRPWLAGGEIKFIIVSELIFGLTLTGWSLLRGFQPNIDGLEKFMDFGFLNSILRSHWLPPADPWFAGQSINYYYFGHFQAAILTLFSGLPSFIAYNLLIATIFALAFSGGLVLILSWLSDRVTRLAQKRYLWAAALIGVLLFTLGGNLHTIVFVLKDGPAHYWYPNATRFIGYYPPNPHDRTIHEFPSYSFIVADLHAHLNDLPLVLLFLFSLGIFVRCRFRWGMAAFLGWLLGIMFTTNAWDFPIYGGLLALVTGFYWKNNWRRWLRFGSLTLLAALLTALPFYLSFHSITQGIAFTPTHSLWWQLLILWGFFWLVAAFYWIVLVWQKRRQKMDRFVLALTVWATFLVFLPEVIYVRDIYAVGYHRANTMFKLVYQAFVLYALASGYIFARFRQLATKSGRWWFRLTLVAMGLGAAAQLLFIVFAVRGYYGRLTIKRYQGLDGRRWFRQKMADDYQIYLWLNHLHGQPVILEAAGQSYTHDDRLSAYTGLPTVEGWLVHEWLWRGGYEIPARRQKEVEAIYQGKNKTVARYLLKKYHVRYVIIGSRERDHYPDLDETRFQKWGTIVAQAGKSKVYYLNKL